jgi:hypothetical protein
MSAKITLAALATLMTALSVQSSSARPLDNRPGHGINGFKFGTAGDLAPFARSPGDVAFGGRVLGRDPDANVRMELLRDFDHSRL